MAPDQSDLEAVKEANDRFYDAFGALDVQRMEEVWETSDRAVCVHPGWEPLVGWQKVKKSWEGIFRNTTLMHFNLNYLKVVVEGDCGWVTCAEHISSVLQGRASNFGVLSTNIFIRTPEGWRMIVHHASPQM